jgi:hypothetical protein
MTKMPLKGSRFKLSPLGATRCRRFFAREGVIVGCSRANSSVRVLFEVTNRLYRFTETIPTTFPARILNGLHVQTQVGRYLRQVNSTACWGVVRASGGEFVVPDWPVHAFIPINPILALANPAINQTLNRESVGAVNKQLKSASRRYFFARDFAACP